VRLVVDTNIWISALIKPGSSADALIHLIADRQLVLLVSEEQFEEFRRVSRYDRIRAYTRPAKAGRFVRELRDLGISVDPLPFVDVSPDPSDNFLLAMAQAGDADFLISGDKRDILELGEHGRTKIVSVRTFLGLDS
jgi:uncharacterized protein